MSRNTPHIISIIVLIVFHTCCFSQSRIAVRASINRDKIVIGEPIQLTLEARIPAGSDAHWFPLDSMAHFEFIDKGKIDTSVNGDARNFKQVLLITSFDSGRWTLPALPLAAGNKEYLTDSLPVSVAYSNFDPKQDYHDIKDIIAVENTATKYVNWILLGVAILSLAALVWIMRKKVTRPVAQQPKKPLLKRTPLQEAMEALEELARRGYGEAASTKAFHADLNDILRTYMFRKTNVPTMEKTSGELMLQLRQTKLQPEAFTTLAQALRMNDAVKFAKYQPGASENQEAFNTIQQSVQQLDTIIT